MKVYAVEWTTCTFESDYGIISLHTTLKGAYNAQLKYILDKWDERLESLRECRDFEDDPNEIKFWDDRIKEIESEPFKHEAWRIRPIEVHDE